MARPSRLQLLLGVVLLAIVGFLVVLGYGLVRQPERFAQAAGVNSVGHLGRIMPGSAPEFELTLFDGGHLSLSSLRGSPVVLNFWASWCVPCRDEAPVFERQWQAYGGSGVKFIGLDVWDNEDGARSFLKEFHLDYPNGFDPQGTVLLRYGVTGIPETFFIRPDATIAVHWVGPLNDSQLSSYTEQLLSSGGSAQG